MASPAEDLKKFAQSVYLVIKNRYYDDIEGEDGQIFTQQVCDWLNMYADELENTVGLDGQLIDWWFNREDGAELGIVTAGDNSIAIPSGVDHLITDELRYVQILQDASVIANFAVVHPKDITNRTDRVTEDMCAVVGTSIVFSRQFKDTEANGTIVGDVSNSIPRVAYTLDTDGFTVKPTNVKMLSVVRPKLLLQYGVAKNATLPDIVQGGLSPSYAQKYDTLLAGAVARSTATSQSAQAARQNYGSVRGVY